jgi:hypothetical protein
MSDTIDMFRALGDHRQAIRKAFGAPCPQCNVKQPKRQPTILLPQQRCKVDGYRDPRPYLTSEQHQAVADARAQS